MRTIPLRAERWIPRRMTVITALLILMGMVGGCTYHPNFDGRPSYEAVQQVKALDAGKKGPISIDWSPSSFPDRIDEIGPSGKEGAARVMRVPTGIALSERVEELLDAAIGISPSHGPTLIIEVREAKSQYRFAQTFITNRHIDWAQCTLDACFRFGDRSWNQRFVARAAKDETGLQGSALLERVWDDVAILVAEKVVENLPDSTGTEKSISTAPTPRTAGDPSDEPSLAKQIETLKRILIRKGLINETEWAEALAEIAGEGAAPRPAIK